MSRADYFRSVVGELGSRLGLKDVRIDAQDRASLAFNDIPITFSHALEPVELVWFHIKLGEIAEEKQDEAAEYLLRLALSTWTSNVMTIGLANDGKTVMGKSALLIDEFDCDRVVKLVEQILNIGMSAAECLRKSDFPGSRPPDDQRASDPGGFLRA